VLRRTPGARPAYLLEITRRRVDSESLRARDRFRACDTNSNRLAIVELVLRFLQLPALGTRSPARAFAILSSETSVAARPARDSCNPSAAASNAPLLFD